MKVCPICDRSLPDDAFRTRQFKQPLPLCVAKCWPAWRVKSAEQSITALSNQSSMGRRLQDDVIEPWQLRISDLESNQIKKQTTDVTETIDAMMRLAKDKKLPVNPKYQRRR